jgi:exopolyphosphatase / guanosine-5'-triphosphate,3'-diphosphate pyrophosphatase
VRRACIDIGSNTTRLLVAECDAEQLLEIHQERVFTRVSRGLLGDGTISASKIAEVVDVVVGQLKNARELGAGDVRAVATAAIRRSGNGAALVAAVRNACGLAVEILSGEEEARLAFVGAARTLGRQPDGELGVVDVGGGSSELVVGTAPDKVSWCASFEVGSGDLAAEHLKSDPPSPAELSRARAQVASAIAGLSVPRPAEAVAVGGSAASLRRLAGDVLDADAFNRALRVLGTERARDVAKRFALDIERVRLLPAGLLILQAASDLFGVSLMVGRGGIREGVLLEAAAL